MYIRRGHFRTLPSSSKRVYVRPTTGISKLRKGMLTMYGYRPKFSLERRKQALMRALRKTPIGTLIKRLTAVSTLTKRTIPKVSRVYKKNRNWIRKQSVRM